LPEDNVLIFYKFGENAKSLNLALEREEKTISSSVKKPFLPMNYTHQRSIIGKDNGLIED
jgi:hypothetical protein